MLNGTCLTCPARGPCTSSAPQLLHRNFCTATRGEASTCHYHRQRMVATRCYLDPLSRGLTTVQAHDPGTGTRCYDAFRASGHPIPHWSGGQKAPVPGLREPCTTAPESSARIRSPCKRAPFDKNLTGQARGWFQRAVSVVQGHACVRAGARLRTTGAFFCSVCRLPGRAPPILSMQGERLQLPRRARYEAQICRKTRCE